MLFCFFSSLNGGNWLGPPPVSFSHDSNDNDRGGLTVSVTDRQELPTIEGVSLIACSTQVD